MSAIDIRPANATDLSAIPAAIEYRYNLDNSGVYDQVFSGAKNAAAYYLQAVLTNPNYYSVTLTASLTIEPYDLTVNWDGDSVYTYTSYDQSQNISASVTLINNDALEVGNDGVVQLNIVFFSGDPLVECAFVNAGD